MKKAMLMGLVSLFAVVGTMAQRDGGPKDRTPEQRAEVQTRHLSKQLTLNADQQSKVQAIMLSRANKAEALRADAGLGKSEKKQRMQELKAETDSGLQAVLTPDQYQKYVLMQQQRMDKARERRKGGHAGDE